MATEDDAFKSMALASLPPATDDPLGADQMRQMQAMLSMAAAMPPPSAADGGLGTMPQIDPTVVQAYMAHMCQYLQQGLAQQQGGLGGPSAGGMHGLPPMPFASMATPYAPQVASEPSISVSVEGMKFQYQLTDDDLQKVFSRYGKVNTIRVDEAGSSAIISFLSAQDAQAAMSDLNGKVLNGLEGTLRIQWTAPTASLVAPPYPTMPFPGWNFPAPAGASVWPPPPAAGVPAAAVGAASRPACGAGAAAGGTAPGGGAAGGAAGASAAAAATVTEAGRHMKGVRKYTCRFLIGIENDKDFQVARRIIGAKGVNMKRIVKQTEAKLRLRGKGSGYFEGTGQKESSEPLQLCISCTNMDGYRSAVQQAEELLKRLYEEYRMYCRDHGRPVPDLQINLSENQLVYSRAPQTSVVVPGSPYGEDPPVDADANEASSKEKGKRGRRSRARGRDGKSSGGELDRGEPGPNAPNVEEIERIIDERNEARRACNFSEADRIRERLVARGVLLMDEPGGRGRGAEVTTWRYWRD